MFQLIENYSHRKFFEIPRLDSQTFAIIVERDICRSTKVDVRNQEFDIDELASEKAVCTPWKLVEYEEIVQHLRAKTKIFEEQVQRNANRWSIQLTEVTSSSRPNNQYLFSCFDRIDTMILLLFIVSPYVFSIVVFFSITWNIVYRWKKFCKKLYG